VIRALLSEVKLWIPLSSSQATPTGVAMRLVWHEIVTSILLGELSRFLDGATEFSTTIPFATIDYYT